MYILGILLAIVVLLSPSQAMAAYGINRTINFQGKLVTSAGVNVPNSTPVTATFSIYQTNGSCPGGGSAVWSENQTFTPVDGIFQVALGSQTAFASSIDFSQDTLYLGIKISTETNEMCSGSSRVKLAAVPYAFNAEKFAGMSGDNSQTNYFTVTGGQGTPATLKVNGNITVGSIITPTSTGGLTIQSNGANTLALDTGSAAALNIGATSNAITIGNSTNSDSVAINSGTGDITLTSTDDVSIDGGGASAQINIGTAAVSQGITLGNSTGGAIRIGQNGSTLQLDGTNFDLGTTGLVTLIGGLSTDITTQGNSNMTLNPGGTGAFVVNTGNTSASALDLNATGTVAGNAITLDTTDGGIALTAAGASNGDITLNSTDDMTLNGTAGSLLNIGTSAVTQTITIGAATNTDLALLDAQWSVTGAGVASFITGSVLGSQTFTTNNITDTGALTIKSASGANALTLDSGSTGNVNLGTGANAKTISVGTGAVANTITIGSSSATGVSITDNNWSIGTGGAAVFTALNLGSSGFASCDVLGTNSSGDATCQTDSFNAVTATNTNNVTWADNDTTDLWTTLSNLQISVSAGSEVLVMASFNTTAVDPASTGVSLSARIDQTGSTSACSDGTGGTVGFTFNGEGTEAAAGNTARTASGNITFVDDSTSAGGTFEYDVCTSADTMIGGGTWVLDNVSLTLVEINDSGDLAEIYPTNDSSLQMAEVVSIDPSLEGGILRSTQAYDKNLLGVITTKPALVIGGRDGQGVDGKPVALTGRVPVKVANVNGSIKAGDPLTSSDIAGVAMKATKAGPILGVAMRDFTGTGIGSVLTYVKTGYYTGGNLADIVKDVSPDQAQKAILQHFMTEKPATTSANLSELVADRVVAGLEVITPTIYADQIFANKIQVRQIEGIEDIIASQSANFVTNSGLEMLSDKYSILEKQVASLSGLLVNSPTPTLLMPSPTLTPTPSLDLKVLGQLLATQGLTVSGPAVFGDWVKFEKSPQFPADTAGYAVIQKNTDRVDIVFDKEYLNPPIVIVDSNSNRGNYVYTLANKTTKGFTVVLDKKAEEEIQMTWMALAVNNPKTFMSILPTPTPLPTVMPTPEPASASATMPP